MLHRLISAMDRTRFDPEVISLTEIGPIGRKIETLGVPVRPLHMAKGVANPFRLLELAWLLRKWRPKVVQTWMMHGDLLGGLAAVLAGSVPVVWGVHQTRLEPAFTKWTSRATLRCCSGLARAIPSKIVCCSEASMVTHGALGYPQSKMVVIRNGFDIERLQRDPRAGEEIRSELSLAAGTPVIGLIARFHPQKDHRTFFQAANLLLRRIPRVHFVLCGEGATAEQPILQEFVASSISAESFHLLGSRQDISKVISSFTLATLASAWGEAFPLAIGEAMCCEVPCVATDVGDVAWMISKTGKIVPPGDPLALSNAWFEVLTMSATARRELGGAARKRVADHFSLRSIVSQYEKLYSDIVGC